VIDEGRPPPGEPGQDPEGMLRPEAVILGDNALIPPSNLIQPPPNHFTHEVVVDEPFRFGSASGGTEPDGVLLKGTPVVLLVEGSAHCRVVAGNGLYVEVRRLSLHERGISDR
jgi:hypothetical protein